MFKMQIQRLYNWRVALFLLCLLLIGGFAGAKAVAELPPDSREANAVTDAAQAGVALSPGYRQDADPGSVVTYTHVITNTGDVTDTFMLEAASSQGWPVALGGGAHLTGSLSLRLPVQLGAGLSNTFQLSLSVPTVVMSGTVNVITGTVDTTVITATLLSDPRVYAVVTDTTTVRPSGPSETQTVSLPLVLSNYRSGPSLELGVGFGLVTTDTEILTHDLPLVKEMGADWVRVDLPWAAIEPIRGQYDWSVFDTLIQRLVDLELEPLAVIHIAPPWAAEMSCGPISDTLAFERFLEVALTRYRDDVDAWEFINEPEGRADNPPGVGQGCWGYSPEAYVTHLRLFHEKVKALDPGALVVFGGLAYDSWIKFERSFFKETLKNGAGPYFDVANLHYYPINKGEFPTLAHKVDEIREIMTRNGVTNKRIWVTETGMWVNDIGVPGLNGSLDLQRDFVVQEQTRGFAAGVDRLFWFDVREHDAPEDAVHRWLIGKDHQPINGYDTYQHFAKKIEAFTYPERYQDVPVDVEAYQFIKPGRVLYVLWSNTITQTVTIPALRDAALVDRDGQDTRVIPPQNGQVSFEVGLRPVFLEIDQTSPVRN